MKDAKFTLKSARYYNGLTQKEAAKRIGVSVPTLASYEHGERFPNVPTIKAIEAVYGVSYNDLIFLPESTGINGTQ